MVKRPSLTIGVEEEYQIIDPATGDLKAAITELMEQTGAQNVEKGVLKEHGIKPEMHQSMVELGTPICHNMTQLADELRSQRASIISLAAEHNLAIVAAATHPFSHWAQQEITPFDRYKGVVQDMQILAQRLLIFGMHVHIGIEDRDFAIDCMNVVRYMLPHILALSTSSPFWLGQNTGFKSYRSIVFEDFPRSGVPERFEAWGEFQRFVDLLINTGCIPNGSKIWWDVRPHYSFPTIEFRVCDMVTRVDEAIAIAALLQALVAWLWELRRRNITFRVYRRDYIEENKRRAVQQGIDGKLIDFGKNVEVPTRQLVREILRLVDEQVEELGSREAIEPIYRILEHGTSADRQIRVFEKTHDVRAVVDHLVTETKMGI